VSSSSIIVLLTICADEFGSCFETHFIGGNPHRHNAGRPGVGIVGGEVSSRQEKFHGVAVISGIRAKVNKGAVQSTPALII
jgi:hypothetical protein